MANPAKQKGTKGEGEIKSLLEEIFQRGFRRTSPGCAWDLESVDNFDAGVIHVLATRPDRGSWLLTMTPDDWALDPFTQKILVEVKRYARFAHHSIYEETWG